MCIINYNGLLKLKQAFTKEPGNLNMITVQHLQFYTEFCLGVAFLVRLWSSIYMFVYFKINGPWIMNAITI
jgi:hypothetical protein